MKGGAAGAKMAAGGSKLGAAARGATRASSPCRVKELPKLFLTSEKRTPSRAKVINAWLDICSGGVYIYYICF